MGMSKAIQLCLEQTEAEDESRSLKVPYDSSDACSDFTDSDISGTRSAYACFIGSFRLKQGYRKARIFFAGLNRRDPQKYVVLTIKRIGLTAGENEQRREIMKN